MFANAENTPHVDWTCTYINIAWLSVNVPLLQIHVQALIVASNGSVSKTTYQKQFLWIWNLGVATIKQKQPQRILTYVRHPLKRVTCVAPGTWFDAAPPSDPKPGEMLLRPDIDVDRVCMVRIEKCFSQASSTAVRTCLASLANNVPPASTCGIGSSAKNWIYMHVQVAYQLHGRNAINCVLV